MKDKIVKLFKDVGREYIIRGYLSEAEIQNGNDIHAFYRLTQNPAQVIHVQGYPGLSNENEARIWARLMDYDKMIWLREKRKASPGNEHQATIRFFPNFETIFTDSGVGIMLPYETEELKERLELMVPELRKF